MRALLRRTRVRLTATYTALFIVLAAAVATASYVAYARSQYAATDSELSERVESLINGLEIDAVPVTFDHTDAIPDAEQGEVSATLIGLDGQVRDTIGKPVSVALARRVLALHPTVAAPVDETVADVQGNYRVFAKPVDVGSGSQLVVVGSHPMAEVQIALDQAKLLILLFLAAMVAIASLLGYWLAGRALKPVRMIAGAARQMSEHDLHRRISLDLPPDELGELAETFNGMLARLEAGFGTLQRFTADAAHELRAPLAMIRAELEVSLARQRSGPEYEATQRLVLSEVERMSRLADQLLLLARADAGSLAPRFQRVDVSDLLEETVDRWRLLAGIAGGPARARAARRRGRCGATPSSSAGSSTTSSTTPSATARAGTDVVLTASSEDGRWRFEVADAGPGVPEVDPRPPLRALHPRRPRPGTRHRRRRARPRAVRGDRRPPRRHREPRPAERAAVRRPLPGRPRRRPPGAGCRLDPGAADQVDPGGELAGDGEDQIGRRQGAGVEPGPGAVDAPAAKDGDAAVEHPGDHHGGVDALLGEMAEELLDDDEAGDPDRLPASGEEVREHLRGDRPDPDDVEEGVVAGGPAAHQLAGPEAAHHPLVAAIAAQPALAAGEEEHPLEVLRLGPEVAGEPVGAEGRDERVELDEDALEAAVDDHLLGERGELGDDGDRAPGGGHRGGVGRRGGGGGSAPRADRDDQLAAVGVERVQHRTRAASRRSRRRCTRSLHAICPQSPFARVVSIWATSGAGKRCARRRRVRATPPLRPSLAASWRASRD